MRLLLVFFGNDYHGGTSYSTATIAKELAGRGHEVHAYLNKTREGRLAADLESYGVTLHFGRAPIAVHPLSESRPLWKVARFGLERARRYYSMPKAEREIAQVIKDCGIELVALSSGAIVSGADAAKRAGVPYVWHRREFMEEDHGLTYYRWARHEERLRDAASLICVSEAVRAKMERLCPGAKAVVVYNGIDEERFYLEGRTDAAAGEPLRLMFSGGIKRSKGTYLVLDALAQLGTDIPWTLDLYGAAGVAEGDRESDFDASCAKLGLSDDVHYRGMVTNIADECRRHDIQIVASRAEAFGRVTAESMFCGCTVVGSDSGGTPELISGDRGYLFEAGSAVSLAAALREAAADPVERLRRSSRAFAYARENFSVNAYIEGIEAAYLSAIG